VEHWVVTANCDGKDYPLVGTNSQADTAARTRVDANTVRMIYKKAGKVTATQISVVSKDAPGFFPPAAGFRFGVYTLGPDTVTKSEGMDFGAALAEVAQKLPGLADSMEPAAPGMHTTATVDYDFVLSGEVWLELDNGAQVQLRAGDCVVQNGTRHAWRNKSSAPCVLAFALVGAQRTG